MAHETIERSASPEPGTAPPTGVPLLTLVLSGALRMRLDGEDPGEPPAG